PSPPAPGCVSGSHTLQQMHGCDLLEDGAIRGYDQIAYDGKDFIAFDMDTMTFTAADAAAQIMKTEWEEEGILAQQLKHELEITCFENLKRYVEHGK
ncbi:HA1F protein, partial [Penelope pileata]|nr:HA1F protein [Penelope pileata]